MSAAKTVEPAAQLRQLAQDLIKAAAQSGNHHAAASSNIIAGAFEVIAQAMEPCIDCGRPDPAAPVPAAVLDVAALSVADQMFVDGMNMAAKIATEDNPETGV